METLPRALFKALCVLVVGLCVVLTITAPAQQASAPGPSQTEINQQLLNRLQELEKEVQALKGTASDGARAASGGAGSGGRGPARSGSRKRGAGGE